jgi:hypothetical protein
MTLFLRVIDQCAHFPLGLFMSVHIFFMPVIQIVLRVHTFFLWLVQCAQFSATQRPQYSGSGFRAPGPGGRAGKGGGEGVKIHSQ